MKLFKDKRWSGAEEHFAGPSIIKVKDESVSVDYEFKSESGRFLGFGYDLPLDFADTDEMYEYLTSGGRQSYNPLWNKILKFSIDAFDSPIAFLVSDNFVYYLPSGTRQTNPRVWEKENTLQGIITLLKGRDERILNNAKAKKIIDDENNNLLSIKEMKAVLNAQQITALTAKPFFLEASSIERIPSTMNPNHLKTKINSIELKSLCINADDLKTIKIKAYYYNRERMENCGDDPEESGGWTETVFLTINDFGVIEKSNNQKAKEIKYRLLKFN